MSRPMIVFGVNVYESPYAVTVRVTHGIERNPIKKRRRNWRVVRNEHHDPAMFKTAQGFIVHPALMKKLKQAAQGGSNE